MTKHLQSQGVEISQYAVRAIKKLNQLYCKLHKSFKKTINSDHNHPVFDNLLVQQFNTAHQNRTLVSDITDIWTNEGLLYSAALKYIYIKQVVSYSLNEHMTAQLVCNALSMAIRNQKPRQGLIVHSLAKQCFSGSQYCSHEYRNMLEKSGFQGSMSKKGD